MLTFHLNTVVTIMCVGGFVCVCVRAQASEMATFVQAKRDLGCKAPQVTILEEGINTDSKWAKEFWSLLGGKTQYRGSYTHAHTHTSLSACKVFNGISAFRGFLS